MANYILNYKGKYRILPEIDMATNDFPRDEYGEIDEDNGLYITCKYDSKIYYWGLNESRRAILMAYIPSLGRGRNVTKAMKKAGVGFFDYDESDAEVMFKFMPADIDFVAELMGAKVSGAKTSPFSTKNLPKVKDVLPLEKMEEYKAICAKIKKGDYLIINNLNKVFLDTILAKKLRNPGKRKPFMYDQDMKKMKMSRDVKGYVYTKGLWKEYCDFLNKEIDKHYNEKK